MAPSSHTNSSQKAWTPSNRNQRFVQVVEAKLVAREKVGPVSPSIKLYLPWNNCYQSNEEQEGRDLGLISRGNLLTNTSSGDPKQLVNGKSLFKEGSQCQWSCSVPLKMLYPSSKVHSTSAEETNCDKVTWDSLCKLWICFITID